jgi:hypothetical protein
VAAKSEEEVEEREIHCFHVPGSGFSVLPQNSEVWAAENCPVSGHMKRLLASQVVMFIMLVRPLLQRMWANRRQQCKQHVKFIVIVKWKKKLMEEEEKEVCGEHATVWKCMEIHRHTSRTSSSSSSSFV